MDDELTLRVEPKGVMPELNVPMALGSPMTGQKYIFTPKKILKVRWHPDGAVIIDVKGKRQAWNGGDSN